MRQVVNSFNPFLTPAEKPKAQSTTRAIGEHIGGKLLTPTKVFRETADCARDLVKILTTKDEKLTPELKAKVIGDPEKGIAPDPIFAHAVKMAQSSKVANLPLLHRLTGVNGFKLFLAFVGADDPAKIPVNRIGNIVAAMLQCPVPAMYVEQCVVKNPALRFGTLQTTKAGNVVNRYPTFKEWNEIGDCITTGQNVPAQLVTTVNKPAK